MRTIGTVVFFVIVGSVIEFISAMIVPLLILLASCIIFQMSGAISPSPRAPKKNHEAIKSAGVRSAKRQFDSGLAHTPMEHSSAFNKSDKSTIIKDIKRNGGLIIDKKWLKLILDGKKTWEMRATKYKQEGYIALIEKGSKTVLGIARIDGYSEKLTIKQLRANKAKHRIPESTYSAESYKWFVAMKLAKVVRFEEPIKYQPKPGAVIWIKIGEQEAVMREVARQIDILSKKSANGLQQKPSVNVLDIDSSKHWLKKLIKNEPLSKGAMGKKPCADDETVFSEKNGFKDGLIHLKDNQREYRFESYRDALSALRRLPDLQWRCFKSNKSGWKKTSTWV
ncbi:ASCH domain-containing protein [Idiomarina loihiensis]|uniref:ASCH domain-containing protein n=1 Tax=Idiomarina loihiensis TaxID=135577 RepID=UPI00384AAD75